MSPCVYVSLRFCEDEPRCPQKSEKGLRSSGTKIKGSCEPRMWVPGYKLSQACAVLPQDMDQNLQAPGQLTVMLRVGL